MDYTKYSYRDLAVLQSLINVAKPNKLTKIKFKGELIKTEEAENLLESLKEYFKDRHK